MRPPVPLDVKRLRTTSSVIYLNNLDGAINGLRRQAASGDPVSMLKLADDLAYRGGISGRLEDTEEALVWVARAIARAPDASRAYRVRARLRSHLHDFAGALADLKRAEDLGARAEDLESLRLQIRHEFGEDLTAEWLERARRHPSLYSYAALANARIDQGNLGEAERLFTQAQHLYADTSPLPLAWLHVQHGIALLRHDELERARTFFKAAYERFPEYALAAEHLAETEMRLGNLERARELYVAVSTQTDNPEFYRSLADVEQALGNVPAAADADARALRRYEFLLAKYPQAIRDHAARYFLDRGLPERAVELARKNKALRTNLTSLLLLAEAELRAGHREAACAAWQSALATGVRPPELRELGEQFKHCSS